MTHDNNNNNNSSNDIHESSTNTLQKTTSSSSSSSSTPRTTTTLQRVVAVIPQLQIPFTTQYHPPPPPPPLVSPDNSRKNDKDSGSGGNNNDEDYYSNNPTVFGDILRGTGRARIIAETNDLLAFVDRTPQSLTLHALIIPKRYIPTIHEVQSNDIQLIYDMEILGKELLQQYQCHDSYRMVFHVPPYNTVDHLHLHVLCQKDLSLFGRTVKYVYDTPWCISLSTFIEQLKK